MQRLRQSSAWRGRGRGGGALWRLWSRWLGPWGMADGAVKPIVMDVMLMLYDDLMMVDD